MKKHLIGLLLLATSLFCGCSTPLPAGFQEVPSPGWTVMEVRNDLAYDRAWKLVVGMLARDFDLEFQSREDGYLRTAWSYTWNGFYQSQYRVRVTVLFAEDGKTLKIKSDAQALVDDEWVEGVDARLLPGLKEELIGTIGRTIR